MTPWRLLCPPTNQWPAVFSLVSPSTRTWWKKNPEMGVEPSWICTNAEERLRQSKVTRTRTFCFVWKHQDRSLWSCPDSLTVSFCLTLTWFISELFLLFWNVLFLLNETGCQSIIFLGIPTVCRLCKGLRVLFDTELRRNKQTFNCDSQGLICDCSAVNLCPDTLQLHKGQKCNRRSWATCCCVITVTNTVHCVSCL